MSSKLPLKKRVRDDSNVSVSVAVMGNRVVRVGRDGLGDDAFLDQVTSEYPDSWSDYFPPMPASAFPMLPWERVHRLACWALDPNFINTLLHTTKEQEAETIQNHVNIILKRLADKTQDGVGASASADLTEEEEAHDLHMTKQKLAWLLYLMPIFVSKNVISAKGKMVSKLSAFVMHVEFFDGNSSLMGCGAQTFDGPIGKDLGSLNVMGKALDLVIYERLKSTKTKNVLPLSVVYNLRPNMLRSADFPTCRHGTPINQCTRMCGILFDDHESGRAHALAASDVLENLHLLIYITCGAEREAIEDMYRNTGAGSKGFRVAGENASKWLLLLCQHPKERPLKGRRPLLLPKGKLPCRLRNIFVPKTPSKMR